MRLSIFRQSYEELRRSMMVWSLAMFGASGLTMLVFSLLAWLVDLNWLGAQGPASFLFGYEPGAMDLSLAGEWLQAVGFGLVFPMLLVAYAIRLGSWLVAGEEERGSLGLLLSAPLTRSRFVLEKVAVLVVAILQPLLSLTLFLVILGVIKVVPAGSADLWAQLIGLFPLALAFGALALALGCFTGKQRLSQRVSLLVLALAFVISRLPPGFPGSLLLRLASPIYYYDTVFANRMALLALFGLAGVALGLAWASFERRDLAV